MKVRFAMWLGIMGLAACGQGPSGSGPADVTQPDTPSPDAGPQDATSPDVAETDTGPPLAPAEVTGAWVSRLMRSSEGALLLGSEGQGVLRLADGAERSESYNAGIEAPEDRPTRRVLDLRRGAAGSLFAMVQTEDRPAPTHIDVYERPPAGAAWRLRGGGALVGIIPDPVASERVWYYDASELYRSDALGEDRVASGIASAVGGQPGAIVSAAIDPTSPQRIVVAWSGPESDLYVLSDDGGETWTTRPTSFPPGGWRSRFLEDGRLTAWRRHGDLRVGDDVDDLRVRAEDVAAFAETPGGELLVVRDDAVWSLSESELTRLADVPRRGDRPLLVTDLIAGGEGWQAVVTDADGGGVFGLDLEGDWVRLPVVDDYGWVVRPIPGEDGAPLIVSGPPRRLVESAGGRIMRHDPDEGWLSLEGAPANDVLPQVEAGALRLYACNGDITRLWVSDDRGASWEELQTGLITDGPEQSFGACTFVDDPATPGDFWVRYSRAGIAHSGLVRHDRGEFVAPEIQQIGDAGPIPTALAVGEGGRLAAAYDAPDAVYSSTDGGASWTTIGAGLAASILDLELGADGDLLAVTDDGLFRWSGGAWDRDGFEGHVVRDALVAEGTLWIAVWGEGVYRREAASRPFEAVEDTPRLPLGLARSEDGRMFVGSFGAGYVEF